MVTGKLIALGITLAAFMLFIMFAVRAYKTHTLKHEKVLHAYLIVMALTAATLLVLCIVEVWRR